MTARECCIAIYCFALGLCVGAVAELHHVIGIDPACEWALRVTHFFEGAPSNEAPHEEPHVLTDTRPAVLCGHDKNGKVECHQETVVRP